MRRPFVLFALLVAGVAGPSAPAAHAYPMCAETTVKVDILFDNTTTPPCVDYPYGMQCEENWVHKPDTFTVFVAYCYPILFGVPVAQPAETSAHTAP